MLFKKNHLLIGSIASALVLGACSNVSADTDLNWEADNNNGAAQADTVEETGKASQNAQAAVDKAKANFEGEVKEVELEEDDGAYYYEIKLKNGNEEYEVDISAEDLKILEEDYDFDDDNSSKSDEKNERAGDADTISSEEAIKIAEEAVGGKVTEWEYEEEDAEYDLELRVDDGEHDIEIDAKTGDIKENEFDRDDDEDGDDRDDSAAKSNNSNEQSQQDKSSSIISSEEALKIAQNEVGGKVADWEFDDDDAEYEVELNVDGEEYEVEIDARTGNVIEVDD